MIAGTITATHIAQPRPGEPGFRRRTLCGDFGDATFLANHIGLTTSPKKKPRQTGGLGRGFWVPIWGNRMMGEGTPITAC